MPVRVLHWFSLIWLLNVSAPLPQPPLGFDQPLEDLERQRVITPQERLGLETGRVGVPIRSNHRSEACRDGALSRQECASGGCHSNGVSPGDFPALPLSACSDSSVGIAGRWTGRVPIGVCFCRDATTFARAREWESSLVISSCRTGLCK